MTRYTYTCDDCGTENEVPEAVVKLCNEHHRNCDQCGEKAKFDFSSTVYDL